ncbi:hypothetical protein [Nocardia salmonicida]|uniref:hypothetical protein n=1 Tax=Nocardia salmonicida TaxID=53431 RepID=UPI0033F5B6AA
MLDSDGLSALCEPKPPARLRALLAEAKARAAEVLVPAVVCAEVCRGVARTRRVETLVSRKPHDHPWQRPVAIVPTDFDMPGWSVPFSTAHRSVVATWRMHTLLRCVPGMTAVW